MWKPHMSHVSDVGKKNRRNDNLLGVDTLTTQNKIKTRTTHVYFNE